MKNQLRYSLSFALLDLRAAVVVFLVALPMSLGIALASNAPLTAGLISAVIGGIVVTLLSKSSCSVSGPAAGLAAVVAGQIASLGGFEAFAVALMIAGLVQLIFGLLGAGYVASFIPNSVIKGLLAAIGILLILKQVPHLLGHDINPDGDLSFVEHNQGNTLSELISMLGDFHPGAALIGVLSLIFLVLGQKHRRLKASPIPLPLLVVLLGIGLEFFLRFFPTLAIGAEHLVAIPLGENSFDFLATPTLHRWLSICQKPELWFAGLSLAIIASLETLLNLEAIEKIDPQQRLASPNRELMAQGIGNFVAGLLGGIPITSVIVRSSANIEAGSKSKMSSLGHGILLLIALLFFSRILNLIPLSCLAAILIVAGSKLAKRSTFAAMFAQGWHQFIPFLATITAIVLTNLLTGVVLGLLCSISFILHANHRRSFRFYRERYLDCEVLRIEFPLSVSFLTRASLKKVLFESGNYSHILIDASQTEFIDPDIVGLIVDFNRKYAPAKGIQVSLQGFSAYPPLGDQLFFNDLPTSLLQEKISPQEVIAILKAGNKRFVEGKRLNRRVFKQLKRSAKGQFPLAVVLNCMDSRTAPEIVFDTGLGDIFSVRIAGNITSEKIIGSIELGVTLARSKVIIVKGHTNCGAVRASLEYTQASLTHQSHHHGASCVPAVIAELVKSLTEDERQQLIHGSDEKLEELINVLARRNVEHSVACILAGSQVLAQLVASGKVQIVGAMYDIAEGTIEFFE